MKDSLFLQIKKYEKNQICVRDFVSRQEITLILIDRTAIQLVCVFDVTVYTLSFDGLKFSLLKKCFSDYIHRKE